MKTTLEQTEGQLGSSNKKQKTVHNNHTLPPTTSTSPSTFSPPPLMDISISNPTLASANYLPAIKFRIAGTVIKEYGTNSYKLKNEITRCKGANLAIKFANIKGNLVIIATDDQETHETLSADWPENAFTHGIKLLSSKTNLNNKTSYSLIFKSVHREVDLSDASLFSFKDHSMVLTRINNKNGQATTIVRATFTNKDEYTEALNNGIRLGYTRYKGEPEQKLLQCYNCQKVGHSSFSCMARTKCFKCAGPHKSSECNSNHLKCANCNGNHAACSRSCPYIIEAEKKRLERTQKYTNNQAIQTTTETTNRNYKMALTSPPPVDELKEMISSLIKSVMEEQFSSWLSSIKNSFKETIATHIKTSMTNSANTANNRRHSNVNPTSSLPTIHQTNTNKQTAQGKQSNLNNHVH